MAIVGNAPATLDLVVRQGSDFALTLTVELDGDPYDFTGATVTAKMINAAGAEQTSVAWTPTTSTGELVLTLDETATALIQSGWRYYVDVTKASITQPWVAGALSPVALGRGGRSSSTATLSITTDTGATLTISADPGQGVAAHLADTSDAHDASAISLLDTGGHWTATTVEGALAEVPSRYGPRPVLYLPGTSGNYVSAPDAAGLDITGDITVVAKVALDDWTPTGIQTLVAKHDGGSQRSYLLEVNLTSGALRFRHSTDGTSGNELTATSSASPTVSDGSPLWVAATLDVDNGASGHSVRFFTSPDGTTWTQLGTTQTTAGTRSIHAGTATLNIGTIPAGTNMMVGKVYQVDVYSGIGALGVPGGSLVAQYRSDVGVGLRYRDALGNVWTVNGSAWSVMGPVTN